jgi:hypothetical protein
MPTLTVDPLVSIQENILKAIKSSQQRSIDATKSVADLVAPVASKLPKSPLAGILPEPSEVVDAQLAFFDDLVTAHRDYARQLAEAMKPVED